MVRDFPATVTALLVAEHGKTADEAAALVKKHTRIVINGIMGGMSYTSARAVCMAIEMAESEADVEAGRLHDHEDVKRDVL